MAIGLCGYLGWAWIAGASVTAETLPAPEFVAEWGTPGHGPGEFEFPIGIAITAAGEVWVTDHYNSRVQRFDPQGRFLGAFPVTNNPGALTLDASGHVYISHFPASLRNKDLARDCVTVYSPTGEFVRRWGRTGTAEGEFDCPGGLAIDPAGRIYVADQTNRRIQVFDPTGKFLFQWGKYGNAPGEFGGKTSLRSRTGGPHFVALDAAGHVWTTEGANGRIQEFTATGTPLRAWGDNADKPGSFGGTFAGFPGQKTSLQGPVALCFDARGRLWVSAVSGRIQQFSVDGTFLRGVLQGQGTEAGEFFAPHGLAVGRDGALYVVDSFNHRIQKFRVPE